jgi:hypothetical protein
MSPLSWQNAYPTTLTLTAYGESIVKGVAPEFTAEA